MGTRGGGAAHRRAATRARGNGTGDGRGATGARTQQREGGTHERVAGAHGARPCGDPVASRGCLQSPHSLAASEVSPSGKPFRARATCSNAARRGGQACRPIRALLDRRRARARRSQRRCQGRRSARARRAERAGGALADRPHAGSNAALVESDWGIRRCWGADRPARAGGTRRRARGIDASGDSPFEERSTCVRGPLRRVARDAHAAAVALRNARYGWSRRSPNVTRLATCLHGGNARQNLFAAGRAPVGDAAKAHRRAIALRGAQRTGRHGPDVDRIEQRGAQSVQRRGHARIGAAVRARDGNPTAAMMPAAANRRRATSANALIQLGRAARSGRLHEEAIAASREAGVPIEVGRSLVGAAQCVSRGRRVRGRARPAWRGSVPSSRTVLPPAHVGHAAVELAEARLLLGGRHGAPRRSKQRWQSDQRCPRRNAPRSTDRVVALTVRRRRRRLALKQPKEALASADSAVRLARELRRGLALLVSHRVRGARAMTGPAASDAFPRRYPVPSRNSICPARSAPTRR